MNLGNCLPRPCIEKKWNSTFRLRMDFFSEHTKSCNSVVKVNLKRLMKPNSPGSRVKGQIL